jgi:hypothetical protein
MNPLGGADAGQGPDAGQGRNGGQGRTAAASDDGHERRRPRESEGSAVGSDPPAAVNPPGGYGIRWCLAA